MLRNRLLAVYRRARAKVASAVQQLMAKPPRLIPVDYIPGVIYNTDGTYLYGVPIGLTANNREFGRYDLATNTWTILYDFGVGFNVINVFCIDGLIFVSVENLATKINTLWRSTDGGSTFTLSLNVGVPSGGGAQVAGITTLSKETMAKFRQGGQWKLAFGEYNTNNARIAGGTNDEVKLMVSSDNGLTWQKLVAQNNNGTRQTRHIHALHWHEEWGCLLIAYGDGSLDTDGNDFSALVAWYPDIGVWQDNFTFASLESRPGFAVAHGTEAYRAVSFVEFKGYVYTMADTHANVNTQGIYRFKQNFASFERVSGGQLNNDGYYGAVVGDTIAFFDGTTLETTSEFAGFGYTSKDGRNWAKVARVNLGYARSTETPIPTGMGGTTPSPKGMFAVGNRLYVHYGNTSSNKYFGATVLEVGGAFIADSPEIVHPCFFVAPGGVDQATTEAVKGGWTPRNPLATPLYALNSKRVTPGSRLLVAPGTYAAPQPTGGAFKLNWSANNFRDGELGQPVVISGMGSAASDVKIYQPATDTTASHYVYTEQTNHNLRFENLQIWTEAAGKRLFSTTVANNVEIVNAIIGSLSVAQVAEYVRAGVSGWSVKFKRCRILSPAGSAYPLITSQGAGETLEIVTSLLFGGLKSIYVNATTNAITVRQSALLNTVSHGIDIVAAFVGAFDVKSTVFQSIGGNPINDVSLTIDTLAEVDYIAIDKSTQPVSIGTLAGHHNVTLTAPGITLDAAANITAVSSQLVNVGIGSAAYDIDGNQFGNPPTLGAKQSL